MRLADLLLHCGCGATWTEETPRAAGAAAAASSAPRGHSAAPRNSRRRRLGRCKGAGDGPSATWRPSLSAISESSAPATAAGEGKASAAGGAAKVKAAVSRRVLPRSHSDDHRYIDSSSAAQAFSPTAFLF